MPLQDGNGQNNFVRADVVFVDSRDSRKVDKDTFLFTLPENYHHVTGIEIQDFFVPESFFSQFSQNNKVDIELQNPFIYGGQPKIITAEIAQVGLEKRSALNFDLFTILYKSIRLAISRDTDFGGKVDIIPLFNANGRLTFVCRTMAFIPGTPISYRLTLPSSTELLSASDLYSDSYLLERNLQREKLTKFYPPPTSEEQPAKNSTKCTFLFGSGPNRHNSAAQRLGFLENDIIFQEYSPYGVTLAKDPVIAAASTNRPVGGTFSMVDGVTLVIGDRILLGNQTNPIENGIYEVIAGFFKVRAYDYQVGASVSNTGILVLQGTSNGGKSFICTNTEGNDVVGTDALVYAQFSPVKIASASFPPDMDRNRYLDVYAKEVSETEALTRIYFPRIKSLSMTKQQELFQVRLLQNPIRELRTLTLILKTEDGSKVLDARFLFTFRIYTIDSSVSPPLAVVQKRINLLG